MKKITFHASVISLLLISILFLTVKTFAIYQGSALLYFYFSLASIGYLILGLAIDSIFFETFMSMFFFLGFWIKFSIRATYFQMEFHEGTGGFTGLASQSDKALLVSSIGLTGFIVAALVRRFFFSNAFKNEGHNAFEHLSKFYWKHRKKILALNILFFIIIAVINLRLGIYQKGLTASLILPFGLNRIVTWLILFGLFSFNATIVHIEAKNSQIPFFVALMTLVECCTTNISLLSRGFILNGSSLVFAEYFRILRQKFKFKFIPYVLLVAAFLALFFYSVLFSNYFRLWKYDVARNNSLPTTSLPNIRVSQLPIDSTKVLFIDRWVGIEGALILSTSPKTGWPLFKEALKEKYKDNGTSYYDLNIVTNSPYLNADLDKYHFISLPGIIAFLFYPGSYVFLFFACFVAGSIGSAFEFFVKKFSANNPFMMSLFGQVIAYRYSNFGYVPMQSYLLFGTIILNVLIFYYADKILGVFCNENKDVDFSR